MLRIVTSEDEVSELAAPWRALAASRRAAPFGDFDPFWTWWKTVGKKAGDRLFIITRWKGERLSGVLPCALHSKAGVRVLRLAGHEALYFRAILAEDAEVLESLFEALRAAKAYDLALIKNIHAESPEEKALRGFAARQEQTALYFREHDSGGRAALKASYKKKLRHKIREIDKDIRADGTLSFGVSSGAELVEEAVSFFVERKTAWCRAQGKKGLFDREGVGLFYERLCSFFAARGALRLFWLRQNGALASVLMAVVSDDTLYQLALALDPALLPRMPGLFLTAEALSWAAEEGFRESNFMEGDEPYKERFATGARLIGEYAYARSLKGKLFLFARTVLRARKNKK